MKKTITSLIFTLIFTPHILGMETNTLQIPEHFPYECSKHILLEYAQNVHRYICKITYSKRHRKTSNIIVSVSLVNKNLYQELEKERNDPITARTIISNIRNTWYLPAYDSPANLNRLRFPGAKKCIALSEQLYDENLTIDKLEQLFTEGAILDFSFTDNRQPPIQEAPLEYWCHRFRRNKAQSNAIMEKLLELGADPNQDDILAYITNSRKDVDLIKTLLKYKPRITHCLWSSVLSNNEYLDLLVSYATPDEMTDGLLECITPSFAPTTLFYQPEKMLKFINNGANPNIALHHLIEKLQRIPCSLNSDTFFIKIFNFLCEHKAFDQTGLDQLKNIQTLFSSFITTLENNRLK